MKKNLTRLIIIFLGLALFFIFSNSKNQKELLHYKINNVMLPLLIADTPDEWERGLMSRKKLDSAAGMIFIFPDKQVRTFWNKNTYLDLDVYWLDDDKIVGKSFLPSIEKSKEVVTVTSPKPVNKVIELVR